MDDSSRMFEVAMTTTVAELPALGFEQRRRRTVPTSAQILDNFKRATALFFKRRQPEANRRPLPEKRDAIGGASPTGTAWVSNCTMQAWEEALGMKPLPQQQCKLGIAKKINRKAQPQ